MNEIKELLKQLEQAYTNPKCLEVEKAKRYYNALNNLQQENEFLRQRENKLQMIEQMFKSGSVDLGDLAGLVKEK